jgi:hypothetical protein
VYLPPLPQDLGLPYDLSASDIADPSAKEMLVLLLYLYQTLPQFMPRTTVEFGCRLGETMVGGKGCYTGRVHSHINSGSRFLTGEM